MILVLLPPPTAQNISPIIYLAHLFLFLFSLFLYSVSVFVCVFVFCLVVLCSVCFLYLYQLLFFFCFLFCCICFILLFYYFTYRKLKIQIQLLFSIVFVEFRHFFMFFIGFLTCITCERCIIFSLYVIIHPSFAQYLLVLFRQILLLLFDSSIQVVNCLYLWLTLKPHNRTLSQSPDLSLIYSFGLHAGTRT